MEFIINENAVFPLQKRKRTPTYKYRIRGVSKNGQGDTAFGLNIPANVQEKFGENTTFFMTITDDKIIYTSGCDPRWRQLDRGFKTKNSDSER